jgi:hypothetical protein
VRLNVVEKGGNLDYGNGEESHRRRGGGTVAGSAHTGAGLELNVIAACVIGGASLFGGVGTIGGTMIGAFLIAVVTNGAVLLNITQYWQQVIIGVIIWLAVWWDQVRRRRLSAASEQMERRKAGGDDQRGGARAEPGSAQPA